VVPAFGLSSGGAATISPQEERGVNVLAPVTRQCADDSHLMTLERLVPLSSPPVIGTRLNLRDEGVEKAAQGGRPDATDKSDPPESWPPSVDVFLSY